MAGRLGDYKADVENPLAMIYPSGYLTIKGFNRRFNTFLLDLPNNEVKEGFVSLLANNYLQLRRDSAVEAMEWVTAQRQSGYKQKPCTSRQRSAGLSANTGTRACKPAARG